MVSVGFSLLTWLLVNVWLQVRVWLISVESVIASSTLDDVSLELLVVAEFDCLVSLVAASSSPGRLFDGLVMPFCLEKVMVAGSILVGD